MLRHQLHLKSWFDLPSVREGRAFLGLLRIRSRLLQAGMRLMENRLHAGSLAALQL